MKILELIKNIVIGAVIGVANIIGRQWRDHDGYFECV